MPITPTRTGEYISAKASQRFQLPKNFSSLATQRKVKGGVGIKNDQYYLHLWTHRRCSAFVLAWNNSDEGFLDFPKRPRALMLWPFEIRNAKIDCFYTPSPFAKKRNKRLIHFI